MKCTNICNSAYSGTRSSSCRIGASELKATATPWTLRPKTLHYNDFKMSKRVVRVLELARGVMDELANPIGPRKEYVNNHCGEFMQLIKDIQLTLREEIKSACEYRPFEKCDYSSRISNEICCKKLEYVTAQLDAMKQTIDEYDAAD